MPVVRGCNLPDELLYDVDNHIWFQEQGDGNVKIGMTAELVFRCLHEGSSFHNYYWKCRPVPEATS